MAKFERGFSGDFDAVLEKLHDEILDSSLSATYEAGSDWRHGALRCAVRVYERYSIIGGNRLSASLTLVGDGDQLFLSVITAGGSQGIFVKFNTWGEDAFLNVIQKIANQL